MAKAKEHEEISEIYNKSNYIILPGRKHGVHEFDDLFVAKYRLRADKYRLRADNLVRKTAGTLGLRVKNTGVGLSGSSFIGDINWEEALKLNLALQGETLSLRRFIDLKELLEFGLGGGKVYHGTGKQMHDLREIRAVYDEIFAAKDPWRGESIDAYFIQDPKSRQLYINYNHLLSENNLRPQISEPLEDYLTKEENLSLLEYNKQGLPIKCEGFYYYPPKNNSVAGFDASSGGVGLSCDGDPAVTVFSLGVRHARKKF